MYTKKLWKVCGNGILEAISCVVKLIKIGIDFYVYFVGVVFTLFYIFS